MPLAKLSARAPASAWLIWPRTTWAKAAAMVAIHRAEATSMDQAKNGTRARPMPMGRCATTVVATTTAPSERATIIAPMARLPSRAASVSAPPTPPSTATLVTKIPDRDEPAPQRQRGGPGERDGGRGDLERDDAHRQAQEQGHDAHQHQGDQRAGAQHGGALTQEAVVRGHVHADHGTDHQDQRGQDEREADEEPADGDVVPAADQPLEWPGGRSLRPCAARRGRAGSLGSGLGECHASFCPLPLNPCA